MQICATLVCNTKNSDEQSIICVNYVLRYIADYHTNHHNHNHNRHHNCKNPNHRHDINHHLNINFVLSGSQYSSVVMASEQVRISIFSTYDNEKEGNASTKSWGNYNFADQLLSTISQVDQPPMQIKSDHSDDDHVGIRNGSPESLKGLILFLLMLIMLIQFQNDDRMDKKMVRCKNIFSVWLVFLQKLVHLMSLLDIVKP